MYASLSEKISRTIKVFLEICCMKHQWNFVSIFYDAMKFFDLFVSLQIYSPFMR